MNHSFAYHYIYSKIINTNVLFFEFEKITKLAGTKIKYPEIIPMIQSTIYDKMRLVAQREKFFMHAIYYYILSDACRMLGLEMQKRKGELEYYKKEVFIKGLISFLRKLKIKEEDFAAKLTQFCVVYESKCTYPALDQLAKDVSIITNLNIYPVGKFYLCTWVSPKI